MWRGLVVVVLVVSGTAAADKLEDFKEAVANAGCKSIPYSDTRGNCQSQQSNVHDYCDGSKGQTTCARGVTADLKRALDREQRTLEDLRTKRSEVDHKRSSAPDDQKEDLQRQMEDLDRQIDEQEKRVRQAQDDLDKRKDTVAKTLETLGTCIDYRRAVMNVFAYALDKVRGESDEDIKPYATQLRDRWQAQIAPHEEQISNRENSRTTCENERP